MFHSSHSIPARLATLALAACAAAPSAHAATPYGVDSYIQSKADGHFYRDGRRVRLWGENVQIGHLPTYAEIDNFVARIQALGYNGVRLWASQATFYDGNDPRAFVQSVRWDGSDLDRFDYAVAQLKAAGISIHMTALHNVGTDSLKNDGNAEVKRWATETLAKFPNNKVAQNKVWSFAAYVSDAWLQMRRKHHQFLLQHRNPHSGRTYAAESSVATWELENESQFVQCAMSSSCVKTELPAVAVEKLADKWLNTDTYNPGGAVRFDIDDLLANHYEAYARFIVDRFKTASDTLTTLARGLGPGVRVQPFLYNTGLTSPPSALAHFAYSLGDVASVDGYRSPMASVAAGPSGGYGGGPWVPVSTGGPMPTFMTGFRVAGKALVIYETSFFRPYAYRAEWGPVMAAWALRQDWDAVYLYAQGNGKVVYGEASPGLNNNGANSFYGTVMLPERVYSNCGPGSPYTEGFQHGGDPAVQMGWALGGRLLQSVSESPAVAEEWNIRDDVLYAKPGDNRLAGYPSGFANGLSKAYEKTVAVRFVGTGTPACSNADTNACTPTASPAAPSTFSVTVQPTTAQPLKITTPAGTAVVGHLPQGSLGRLAPTPVDASMPTAGFGVVAGLKSDLAGTGSATHTLIALRDVQNTGYDFRKEDVQLAVPFGAECGVKNAGSAPLLWTGPGVTFTSATPLTFSPYDFRFMKGIGTRGTTYAPPVAATGPEGAAWVDARP
jgi:hypothetical protein